MAEPESGSGSAGVAVMVIPVRIRHTPAVSARRGGAHEEVITRFSDLTTRAAAGDLDHWAATPMGWLALTLVFDQFTRSVWAGTARAYAYDERARDLCLQGLENGHFDALANVWQKAAFKVPLEHCECADPADRLANLDIAIADRLIDEAPPHLRQAYEFGAGQPRRHRAVIARHPHRNAVLGRDSMPDGRPNADRSRLSTHRQRQMDFER